MAYRKQMEEKREQKVQELTNLISGAKTENRAMTDEEQQKFETLEKEIENIDKTLEMEQRASQTRTKENKKTKEETQEEIEERAFCDYVLGVVENRAGEKNLTMGDNGAIVPVTIANRIIKEVKDICPILKNATIYSVKGTLKVPVWGDNSTHNIKVGFQSEFTELTADAGKFTSVDLSGYLVGALTLIGRSVENNASFSVVDFVVAQMAEEIAAFLENKLLNGEDGKNQGALDTTNIVTAAASTAITADELIALQAKVKKVFQKDACWTMHPDTFLMLKQLKDSNGRYLLQDNVTQEFPYMLLGKPVEISDNMPTVAAGAAAILYGDYKGLSVNIRENMEIEVLREKYATQHALGVVAWLEFDSKMTDNQKLAVLKMKAAA